MPPMHWLEQPVVSAALTSDQIRETVWSGVRALPLADVSTVAVAVGSRGIDNIVLIVRSLVEALQAQGLTCFAFPAMGSHGGGTAEGQTDVLAALGVTEASIGCEIRSSMATVEVARSSAGMPVVLDELAAQADGIIVVNRIKPHTHFRGPTESGLVKMLVIGAGKHEQAVLVHSHGVKGLRELIPDFAANLIATGRVLGGVAICEDGHHRVSTVTVLRGTDILTVEPDLLVRARAMMPTLPVDDLDLLIVDRIGKDISGTGMDTNIVGRVRALDFAGFGVPRIRVIYARSLTEATHGNAIGMGLADLVHRRLAAAVDPISTGINSMTGGSPAIGALPIIAGSDLEAMTLFNRYLRGAQPAAETRMIRIRDTLSLNRILVSPAVLRQLGHDIDPSAHSEAFDEAGDFAHR